MLQQYNGYAVFFFLGGGGGGGGGGGVNKVLYGLCENGEYSWTFSPKTNVLIGYFEVTRRLTVKLFPAESFSAGNIANSVTSQGDSALAAAVSFRIDLFSLPALSLSRKRNPSLETKLSASSRSNCFRIGCTNVTFPQNLDHVSARG